MSIPNPNRQPAGTPTGGQFAPGATAEPRLSIGQDSAAHEAEQEQARELAEAARALSIDPTTGAAPQVIRHYSWHDPDPESGNFALWSEDLRNTPASSLSDRGLDDLNSTWSFVEEAAGDPQNATAEDVSQAAYDTYWGFDAATSDYQDSPDAPLWTSLARVARGEQPTAQQSAMVDEVAAHEADRGVVDVDRYDGSVRWRISDDEHAPLYRACADPDGAPALFDPSGQPRVWVRGGVTVREVHNDGQGTVYDPQTGNPTYQVNADGSFAHHDPSEAWALHRDPSEGPALFDENGAGYAVNDSLHRDPDTGPAFVGYDGHVRYFEHGNELAPTPEQMERHGVEAVPAHSPHGHIDPDYVRYQIKGSTSGEQFDLTGHPLDHGHRITDPGPAKDLPIVARLMTLNTERHQESESEQAQVDSAEVKGLIRDGHPAADRLRARFPAEASEVDQEVSR